MSAPKPKPQTPAHKAPSPSKRRLVLPLTLGLAILGLALAWFFGLKDSLSPAAMVAAKDQVADWIQAYAILLFLLWFLVYATATATLFPLASFLTILGGVFGGAAFGLVGGTLYAGTATLLGATAGASVLFLAVRTLGLDTLRKRVAPFLDRFSHGIEEDAFFYLLSLRLVPFFPFAAVNIAPAMLKIRLRVYALATLIGIAPGVYVYTSLGAGVADLESLTLVTWSLWGPLLALAALSLLPIVWKRILARKARSHPTRTHATPTSPGPAPSEAD